MKIDSEVEKVLSENTPTNMRSNNVPKKEGSVIIELTDGNLNDENCSIELARMFKLIGKNAPIELHLYDNEGLSILPCLSEYADYNVVSVHLDNTQVSNVSELSVFGGLKYLSLEDAPLNDVSDIAKLTQLEVLILTSTKITSINGLDNLANLRELRINDTAV